MFSPSPLDTESVAQSLLRRLESAGVTRIFGVPGGACSALDDAAYDSAIEMVVCAHEAIAGYMAMGYHLATGLPGVVVVTSGPGVLNVAPALAAAKTDELGLLVIAGDVARTNASRGALQDGGHAGLDILHAMRPLAGLAINIDRPEQAAIRFEQALNRCTQAPSGPAFVQIPIDVQNAQTPVTSFSLPARRSGAISPPSIGPAAALLAHATAPAILVGLGVKRAGASQALRAFAEHAGIPVLCDAEGFGVLPSDHPLFVGAYGIGDKGAGDAWFENHKPDVLLIVGARLDDTTTNGFSEALGSPRLIQLDYDHRRLARSYSVEAALCGDLASTLNALTDMVPAHAPAKRKRIEDKIAAVRELERPLDDAVAAAVLAPIPRSGFDPRAAVVALQAAFGPNATFVSDIGNHLLAMLRHQTFSHPDRFHFSLGLGGMGSGIGTAMGLAAGGRENVVLVCGDGGTLMSGNDIATCVKYRIRFVMVVFHDRHLGMVEHGTRRVYKKSDPYLTPEFDVVGWAQALGASALKAESIDDFDVASRWEGPGPLVIEVPIDGSVEYPNPRQAVVHFSKEGLSS